MTGMTALEAFKVLLKEHLGPALRDVGWKGSGANWTRLHPTHWVLLGWQKSRASSAASVESTCNLKVISKDAWDAENIPHGRYPDRPSTATTWSVGWEQRLGDLMPGSSDDRWWFVRPGDDLSGIAQEVMVAVTAYGLPAVERELAAAAEQPRVCWYNVGGRNWFEPCRRPAEVELRLGERLMFRCREHAEAVRRRDTGPRPGTGTGTARGTTRRRPDDERGRRLASWWTVATPVKGPATSRAAPRTRRQDPSRPADAPGTPGPTTLF